MQINDIRHSVLEKRLQFLVSRIRHRRGPLGTKRHLRQHDVVQFVVVAVHSIVDNRRKTVNVLQLDGQDFILEIKRVQTK